MKQKQTFEVNSFEPKSKQRKIQSPTSLSTYNDDNSSSQVRILFLDGNLTKHFTYSWLQKKFSSPKTLPRLFLCDLKATGKKIIFDNDDERTNYVFHFPKRLLFTFKVFLDENLTHISVYNIDTIPQFTKLYQINVNLLPFSPICIVDETNHYSNQIVDENNLNNHHSNQKDFSVIMFFEEEGGTDLIKARLDSSGNFTILQKKTTIGKSGYSSIVYSQVRNELFVLTIDSEILVLDGNTLKRKAIHDCCGNQSMNELYHDPTTDSFYVSSHLPAYKSVEWRKYSGGNFMQWQRCIQEDKENKFVGETNLYLVFVCEEYVHLTEKETGITNQSLPISFEFDETFFDKRSSTIYFRKGNELLVRFLDIRTYPIERPISDEICNLLENFGAILPQVIDLNDSPLDYLSDIIWKTNIRLIHKKSVNYNFATEVTSTSTFETVPLKKVMQRFDFGACYLKFTRYGTDMTFKTRKGEELVGIGYGARKKLIIGVAPSELTHNGQLVLDFPIYMVFTQFDTIIKCKFSDFLKSLNSVLNLECSASYRQYLPVCLKVLYNKLLKKGLINKETLEIDHQELFQCYRVLSIRASNFKELVAIIAKFKDESVKIRNKYYLLADLLVLCYTKDLLALNLKPIEDYDD